MRFFGNHKLGLPKLLRRRTRVAALAALVCVAPVPAAAQEQPRFLLSAYGDVLYSHFDYGPDQKSGPNGSLPDSRAIVDIPFFFTKLEYFFTPRLYVEAEVEYEHGGTGSAMELEFEEFGEFEMEVEKGGEVKLEELHFTYAPQPWLNLRAGRFPVALGLLNKSHRPTEFFTTRRSEMEVSLIPTVWDEVGVEVFGRGWRSIYRLQLVNGLDSSGFTSKSWVVEGHQQKFEEVKATDLAVVGRLDVYPVNGLMIGASAYYGNTTQNRPKPDMEGIDGHLMIADVHSLVNLGPIRGRAMAMYGTLENADIISAKNSRLSANLQVTRTPVAKTAAGWYGEVGFDVVWLFSRAASWRLYPFVRYEHFDSMHDVDGGIFDEPRFERKVATAGINVFPHESVVVKLDYAHRTFGADRLNAENTFSIGVGFSTLLLRL